MLQSEQSDTGSEDAMGKLEQVTVGLPVEDLAEVRKAVDAGEYASESEALSAAVRAWREAQATITLSEDDLGALWDDGIASGKGQFSTFDALVAEAERREADRPGRK
jgi:antitoxin ParD1/3/4